MNTTNKRMLENVVADVYDVNALNCDHIVIEWAADRLAETAGIEVAAREWKRVNARRHKLGVYTTIPFLGNALYAAYFGRSGAR
jgi:hypothetical protein